MAEQQGDELVQLVIPLACLSDWCSFTAPSNTLQGKKRTISPKMLDTRSIGWMFPFGLVNLCNLTVPGFGRPCFRTAYPPTQGDPQTSWTEVPSIRVLWIKQRTLKTRAYVEFSGSSPSSSGPDVPKHIKPSEYEKNADSSVQRTQVAAPVD